MSKHHKHHYYNNFQKTMEADNIQKNTGEKEQNPEQMADYAELAVESEQEIATEEVEREEQDLTEQYNELNDRNLRLIAEFDNYRKRTIKERTELIKTANEKVLSDMLPLIDDFARAKSSIDSATEINAIKEGIDLINSKFTAFLSQNGVKEIQASAGDEFNTEYHEAVTMFPAPAEDLKGKIVDCVSKGYMLHDKVIRFAKVVVGE